MFRYAKIGLGRASSQGPGGGRRILARLTEWGSGIAKPSTRASVDVQNGGLMVGNPRLRGGRPRRLDLVDEP